jgi:hypothetical protein
MNLQVRWVPLALMNNVGLNGKKVLWKGQVDSYMQGKHTESNRRILKFLLLVVNPKLMIDVSAFACFICSYVFAHFHFFSRKHMEYLSYP